MFFFLSFDILMKFLYMLFRNDKEFFELVWENGQLLMRDLSRRAQRNPSCNGHPSDKAQVHVKNRGDRFENFDNPYHDKRNLYMNFNYNNCLEDDNFHESLPEVYQTHLYESLEQNKGDSSVKYHKESQVVPEYANLRRKTKSSTKQYRESPPFKRPRANSRKNLVTVHEFPMAKLQEQDLRSGGKRATTNFSPSLGSPALLQVHSQWTGPASAEDSNNNCKRSSPCGNVDPIPIADQPNLMETTVELLPPGAKPADKLLPDNESEAVRREYASPNQIYGQTLNIAANKGNEKLTNTQEAIELPVASSSLCSGGASNNPTYTLKRRYDDSEGSADHPSQVRKKFLIPKTLCLSLFMFSFYIILRKSKLDAECWEKSKEWDKSSAWKQKQSKKYDQNKQT